MRDQFGFAPSISFDAGLRRLVEFFERERHASGRQA
jgi:hypothetical protein